MPRAAAHVVRLVLTLTFLGLWSFVGTGHVARGFVVADGEIWRLADLCLSDGTIGAEADCGLCVLSTAMVAEAPETPGLARINNAGWTPDRLLLVGEGPRPSARAPPDHGIA